MKCDFCNKKGAKNKATGETNNGKSENIFLCEKCFTKLLKDHDISR